MVRLNFTCSVCVKSLWGFFFIPWCYVTLHVRICLNAFLSCQLALAAVRRRLRAVSLLGQELLQPSLPRHTVYSTTGRWRLSMFGLNRRGQSSPATRPVFCGRGRDVPSKAPQLITEGKEVAGHLV